MVIKTKFDIGQTVWVISGDEVRRKKIDTISIYKNNKPTYEMTDNFLQWEEKDIFATKEEAITKWEADELEQRCKELIKKADEIKKGDGKW